MKIEAIAETALDAATEAEIGALLDLCFDGAFEGRSHYVRRHHLRFIRRDGGCIVAHLAMGLILIRQGNRLIDVATVAEVATHPDHRQRGLGAALLAAAIEAARGTVARFMLLYGEKALYGGAGFRDVANIQRRVATEGRHTGAVIEGRLDHLMVLPLTGEPWDGETPIDLLGGVF